MSESLREKIKNSVDLKKEIVHIDVWDCDIEIRTITALERAEILDKISDNEGNIYHDKLRTHMILYSCYEPGTDNKVFFEDDKDWILNKSFGPIEYLTSKIMKNSGMLSKSIEDAEKNLDLEIQKGDFITN